MYSLGLRNTSNNPLLNDKPTSYTIQELEALSGFDRRTIAYYVHEGLLPGVGRRGRGTVYPATFKEGLMFIRAVRDLQDAGSLRAVTLAEIKEIMDRLGSDELRKMQDGPDRDIRALFQLPDWDTRKLAVPVEAVVKNSTRTTDRTDAAEATFSELPDAPASQDYSGLSAKQLIDLIESAVARTADTSASHEQQVRVSISLPLSENIRVSVSGLDPEYSPLLKQLIYKIQKMD